jgi:tetratricopeptide (TPR) repeat protein
LGKRTRFQVKDLSQLVLLARSRERPGEDGKDGKMEGVEVDQGLNPVDTEQVASTSTTKLPDTLPLNDDTLLEETEFSSQPDPFLQSQLTDRLADLDPANQPALHPLDQSLLLSFCLSQHNTSPEHGLTASEMAPYLARVISHPSNWSVHTTALLLRARLESTRSRTVERSALQLQALIDQMPTSDSSTDERFKYFHQLPLPSRWEMENELARRYLGLGVVRSALEIFTRLEMWEEAVKCLVSMERTDRAVEVVKDLLEGRKAEMDIVTLRYKVDAKESSSSSPDAPRRKRARIDAAREAKLWCVLGDLEPEHAEEHYKRAWEVSQGTSSRSQRSLGALYVSRERFGEAVECFRKALKINPLYARTWFALGCCLVREERWEEARDAFSRDVAIEEEDGEAWNNLAAVYLRMSAKREEGTDSEQVGCSFDWFQMRIVNLKNADPPFPPCQNEESIPFANKRLAFLALQQGLRFSRDNWRMWQNYMVVAVDVGELSEAARALSTIVGQRAGKEASLAVDHAVLSKLVDAVTREPWNDGKGDENKEGPVTSNEGLALLPIVDRLFNVVILPRVSDDPRIYAIQARLYRWKEDWAAALECYMKAYRSGVANDEEIERDVKRFREAIEDLEELVNIMQNLGPKAKEQEERAGLVKGKAKWNDWKFQARTLVRTFTGRVKDRCVLFVSSMQGGWS